MKSDILKFMFVLGTERKMFCSNFFHFADERGLAEVCQLGHLTKKQKLLLFLNSPTMYLKYYLKGPLPVVSSILDKSLWTLATVWLTNKKLWAFGTLRSWSNTKTVSQGNPCGWETSKEDSSWTVKMPLLNEGWIQRKTAGEVRS